MSVSIEAILILDLENTSSAIETEIIHSITISAIKIHTIHSLNSSRHAHLMILIVQLNNKINSQAFVLTMNVQDVYKVFQRWLLLLDYLSFSTLNIWITNIIFVFKLINILFYN